MEKGNCPDDYNTVSCNTDSTRPLAETKGEVSVGGEISFIPSKSQKGTLRKGSWLVYIPQWSRVSDTSPAWP